MNTCVLGHLGHWGRKIYQRLLDNSFYQVVATVDLLNTDKGYGEFKTWEEIKKFSDFDDIKLVCIFTPPGSHYEIARDAIINGKHVICAKPLISTLEEIKELYVLADKYNVALLMEYTFLYNSAILKLKELLPLIGIPKLMHSRRMNWGKHQAYGVVADLIPHDISIAHYLFGELYGSVNISKNSSLYNQDFAHVFIKNGTPDIDLTLSWSGPTKDRELYIVGQKGILSVLWDSNIVEFMKIENQKEISREDFKYDNNDALTKEFEVFADLLRNNSYKEVMKQQQKTTELTCKIIEECK